jgi:hypothetical protein
MLARAVYMPIYQPGDFKEEEQKDRYLRYCIQQNNLLSKIMETFSQSDLKRITA